MEIHKNWIRYTELRDTTGPTIGEQAIAMNPQRKYNTHSIYEQVQANLHDFDEQVNICVANGKKHFNGDFYIEVLIKKERLIEDAVMNIFAARRTCPDPFHDQIVYKYIKNGDEIQFLWCIPDRTVCDYYKNILFVVPEDEQDIYEHIVKYYDGTYARLAFTENNRDQKNIIIEG